MPKVEDVIVALQQSQDAQSRLLKIQNEVKDAERQLNLTVADAEKRGREILEAAAQEARAKVLDLSEREKVVTQRETDVTNREQAVSEFPAQQAALDRRAIELAQALKAVDQAKSEFLALQQVWQARAKELDDKATVLEARIAKITDWENKIRQGLPIAAVIS